MALRGIVLGLLLVLIAVATPAPAGAEPARLLPLEPYGVTGYGGPEFKVTWIGGRVAVLGGGPLFVLGIERELWVGAYLNSTEGDADGLQLAYAGPFVGFDLLPDGPLHLSVETIAQGGSAIYDTPDGRRSRGTHLGIEPRLALALDLGPTTRVALAASYRFSRSSRELEPAGIRDTSGPVVGLQLQEGRFRVGTAQPSWALSGCFSTRVTRFAGELTHLDGGGTRVVFHDTWAVGVGGYVTRDWFQRRPAKVSAGWGGVTGEVLLFRGALVRPWLAMMVAMGGVGRRTPAGDETAQLAVFEPTAGAQLGVTEFMRLAAGASYRLAACPKCIDAVSSKSASGPAGVAELRFGAF
ncbi:MAG: hypothetical protein HYZ29_04355 [Myxococcales bacterium]|nr:hypothetical protein [Myxococcales bacterium]